MEQENGQELIPVEQQTLTFYSKPIIVVRLPDSRPAVVLRYLCEGMEIDTNAQVRRIRRTEAIADDLVMARIYTEGGVQKMAALVLHSTPFWLAGINPKQVGENIRADIVKFQREVVDVLYAWASTPRTIAAPQSLVPAEPITQPAAPVLGATPEIWIRYHQQMIAFLEWQTEVEQWRGGLESRVEGIEAIIPDILDRLPPVTLTPARQRQIQVYVKQLGDLTGKHPASIYTDLYTAFSVPRYQDLLEADWDDVEKWFKTQIDRARARKNKKP